MRTRAGIFVVMACVVLAGCATVPRKDYTELRKSQPRSILVLPPINQSSDVGATYSVLTAATRPLAELGYYVFPSVVVDQLLKENGLLMPEDMHSAPISKLREVFGADSVLYITVDQYGSKYQVIVSVVMVHARAKLVDARSEQTLWEGVVICDSYGQGGLMQAVMDQVLNKLTDHAHLVAALATLQLFERPGQGLLKGPLHPAFATD